MMRMSEMPAGLMSGDGGVAVAEKTPMVQGASADRAEGTPRLTYRYAIVPLILILVPMLVEFVLLLTAVIGLQNRATELVQMAAVGASPAVMEAELASAGRVVDGSAVQLAVLRQPGSDTAVASDEWQTLTLSAGQNNAKPGERVQVRLRYEHPLVFGSLLGRLFGASEDGCVALDATAESVRR